MNISRNIHFSNDISLKYGFIVLNKHIQSYLKIKYEYIKSYPTEIITENMENMRMDILYLSKNDILINIEAQTSPVREKELKRFWKYRTFCEFHYMMPVVTIIITTVNPKYCIKEYAISETSIMRPIYIYISPEEIQQKYNNIKNKIYKQEKLSIDESLDIAFIPVFSPEKKSKAMTEEMCELLSVEKTIPYELRRDISFILKIMIFKYISDYKQREGLLEMINMKQFDTDLEYIAYEMYGEKIKTLQNTLNRQKTELNEKETTINEHKKILKEIKEKNNLNPKLSKKIEKILAE